MPADQSKNISLADVKTLAFPLGSLVFLVVLFIIAYGNLSTRISGQRSNLAIQRKNENILSAKRDLLTQLDAESFSLVDSVVMALPSQNAALVMLAQLRGAAAGRLLTLVNIKVDPSRPGDKGLSKVQIQFDIDGEFSQVYSFIKEIANMAPLSTLEIVSIVSSGDIVRASITILTYFAPFPDTLPALTEPLTEFSSSDREVLSVLSQLIPPPFTSVNVGEPVLRADPFE